MTQVNPFRGRRQRPGPTCNNIPKSQRQGWQLTVKLGSLPIRLANYSTMPDGRSLASRLVRRGFLGVLLPAAMLFIPAGTLNFLQGWVFLAINLVFPA